MSPIVVLLGEESFPILFLYRIVVVPHPWVFFVLCYFVMCQMLSVGESIEFSVTSLKYAHLILPS